MKSGVAAIVAAALQLSRARLRGPGMTLVLVAGEETGCEGAAHLARTPGALGRAGALVVAEPTGIQPVIGHKGALWLRARFRGVTAHGSMPERGVNAVVKAARAVLKLADLRFDVAPDPLLGAPTLNVGTFAGGLNLNSVPDEAVIGIDLRTIPAQRHAQVRGRAHRPGRRDLPPHRARMVRGMTGLDELSVAEAVGRLSRRELGAEELVRACLLRIAQREPEVQAWEILAEDAVDQARRIDAQPHRPLLRGLPVGIKDLIDTADLPTTYGSPIYAGHRPKTDAACVA